MNEQRDSSLTPADGCVYYGFATVVEKMRNEEQSGLCVMSDDETADKSHTSKNPMSL